MQHLCNVCNLQFSKHCNLRTHVKKFHPDQLNEIAPNKIYKTEAMCNKCLKSFSKYSNLKKHVIQFHPDNLGQLTSPKVYTYQCQECGKNFSHSNHYKNHQKIHLGDSSVDKRLGVIKCSLCDYETNSKLVLYNHCDENHNITIVTQKLQFSNEQEFHIWKTNLEKGTYSSYINNHGSYTTINNIKNITYVCHRSGFYIKKGSDVRHLKTQGSKKINGICPSELQVKIFKNGNHEVNFVETHVGHNNNLGHLNLTETERMEVASKIAAKVPLSCILDDIRDSITNNKLERMHLLTRKDLNNITRSFNLNSEGVRHKNEVISIEAWIDEVKNSGIVLFYKPQGVSCDVYACLKKEDFILIIMHPGQLEILQEYSEDCICIDGTHGLNAHEFELTTLLVLDDMREGFPCSFLISNRSDEEIMSIFFKTIKEKLGREIEPQVFMSDMAHYYYNAWLQIMSPAKVRLFCTWHVDRAWRKNLCKIDSQEQKVTVYRQLRTLLQETDADAFPKMLQNFVFTMLSSPETSEFGRYFEEHYLKNAKSWAYCHRLRAGINTNMSIERMHQTIKYLYLNGKHVQRLDKTINILMKFIKDKLFDRMITINKGKISTKVKDLRKRHKASQNLDTSSVVPSEMGWEVPSSSTNEIYVIEEKNLNCDCKLRCTLCQVCLHSYSCTCLDNSIRWNMCKHIHLVCRYQESSKNTVPEIRSDDERVLIVDQAENKRIQEQEKLVEILNNSDLNSNKTAEQLEIEKEKLKLFHIQLIQNITSFEQLEAFKKITAPLEPTLLALLNNGQENQLPKSHINTPHNTKIDPQRRFFSTKKSTKKSKKNLLTKPNADEANSIANKLLIA